MRCRSVRSLSSHLTHAQPQGHARAYRRHQGDAEDHQGHADGRGVALNRTGDGIGDPHHRHQLKRREFITLLGGAELRRGELLPDSAYLVLNFRDLLRLHRVACSQTRRQDVFACGSGNSLRRVPETPPLPATHAQARFSFLANDTRMSWMTKVHPRPLESHEEEFYALNCRGGGRSPERAIAYSRVHTGPVPSAVPSSSNSPASHSRLEHGLIAQSC